MAVGEPLLATQDANTQDRRATAKGNVFAQTEGHATGLIKTVAQWTMAAESLCSAGTAMGMESA